MAEGTVSTRVTSLRAERSDRARISSARITLPPVVRGRKVSKMERSKQIDVEANTPERSAGEKIPDAQ
jgi:hypothetical protein